jgi:diadenosine tetraphosphate (Ap4A) HIT family hydrolase
MSDLAIADCPFCTLPVERILAANVDAMAVPDAFPVSPGHTLIVPRRHVADFFDLTSAEVSAVHELLLQVRQQLMTCHAPQGYNVGINVGRVAGQTIMHAHVHLIPRYPGDVANPIGGIRNIIPGRGGYLSGQESSP